ncbi:MAG: hypothetical protein R3324_14480, partial [Halobacteriales archaeon]|nr:hypothetical protein [Halobacteriales archaeon]
MAYRTHAAIIGIHRDSDTLDRSNFAVVSEELLTPHGERSSGNAPSGSAYVRPPHYGELEALNDVPDVVIERFRHWAVGWTETVLVRVARRGRIEEGELPAEPTDAWIEACEWLDQLDNYPVADESHWSELEYRELVEWAHQEYGETYGPVALEEWCSAGCTPEDPDYYVSDVAVSETFAERAEPLIEAHDQWERLMHVGTGQLTIEGETVTVPEPPSLEDVEELLDTVDSGGP